MLLCSSNSETKGAECYETFAKMQECFSRFPGVYKTGDDDEEDDLNDEKLSKMLDKDAQTNTEAENGQSAASNSTSVVEAKSTSQWIFEQI